MLTATIAFKIIMLHDIQEAAADAKTVVVIEWGKTVGSAVPQERTVITFEYDIEPEARRVTIQSKVTTIGEVYATWDTD